MANPPQMTSTDGMIGKINPTKLNKNNTMINVQ